MNRCYRGASNEDSRGEVVDGQIVGRTERRKGRRGRGVEVICCSLKSD